MPAAQEEGGGAEAEALAREQAIRLLARREHSRRELERKLFSRGHAEGAVGAALAALAADGLQSNERYAESYVRSALARGHGERKIRAALRARGVEDGLADAHLALGQEQWLRRASQALRKRFGEAPAEDRKQEAKRLRFLTGRGFPAELAFAAVAGRAD